MDTDLLAFVTGLDPKEAQEVAEELDPGFGKKGKKKGKAQVLPKKVSFAEPTADLAGSMNAASLSDFTSVLADGTSFTNLKRRLGDIAEETDLEKLGVDTAKRRSKAQVIETPLPKVQQDRIERQVAYMQTSKNMSKWQPVIQKNRQAESLSFPLNAPPSITVTNASMVTAFKPKTDLELEMKAALEAAGMANEGDIQKLEEMEMNKLSATEVEARYKALAKQRSLLFFQERKQKHQSKIKSKKFRKIQAKERARETAKKEAELTPAERREKAELARAKERLTLKTRRANKWAQEMIHRAGIESGSRAEIVEQLRDKERLRQEIFGKARDTREDTDDDEEKALFLSESEDDGNNRLNEDYFKDSEAEEDAGEGGSQGKDESACGSEEGSEGEEEIVGRRTFGNVTDDGNAVVSEDEPVKPAGKKQKQAVPKIESLFEVADSEELKAHQSLIKQAFAKDDDLFTEFQAEKEAIVDADAPKTEDLTLPGWGSWAGDGVQAPAVPKVRVLRKAAVVGIDAKKRKDAGLKHVIINEKQNRKVQATWMVPGVPYPYKSKEEYERATRSKPLGPEWSTSATHRKRVAPRVQIKVGSIIDPIKFTKQTNH